MKECKHEKWCKWSIHDTKFGVQLQSRSCKKCGWSESKYTQIWTPEKFKKALKQAIIEILNEIKKEKEKKEED